MKLTVWVLLGGVGLLAAACGGKGVKNVGELNSSAGAGSSAGSGQGSTAGSTTGSAVFYEGPREVRDIAADRTTLYWVEYGSEDSLGKRTDPILLNPICPRSIVFPGGARA